MEAQVIKQVSYKQDGTEEQNIAMLVGQLGNNDPNVRWGAAIGLQRIGVPAAGPLVQVVSEGSASGTPAGDLGSRKDRLPRIRKVPHRGAFKR